MTVKRYAGYDTHEDPAGSYVLASDYDALAARLAAMKHDLDAYRGALGYAVPGDHDGRLSDGSATRCGICEALTARLAEAKREREALREQILGFPNLTAMREAMIATANENEALRERDAYKDAATARDRNEDALRELLRDARVAVAEAANEWGFPYQACLERIDAALERKP